MEIMDAIVILNDREADMHYSNSEIDEACILGMSALRKQIEANTIKDYYETSNGGFLGSVPYYKCSECDGVVGIGASYCESCGNAIKWEE